METIKCLKYITTYFVDPIHCYGHEILVHYYIGEPYYIDISHTIDSLQNVEETVNDYFESGKRFFNNNGLEIFDRDTALNDIINFRVVKMDKPIEKYKEGINIIETKFEEINVSKIWVNNCFNIYKLEKGLQEVKLEAFRRKPKYKLQEELYLELYNEGLERINARDYDGSLEIFLKCFEILEKGAVAYYIGFCYAIKEDYYASDEWLKKSLELGFDDTLVSPKIIDQGIQEKYKKYRDSVNITDTDSNNCFCILF